METDRGAGAVAGLDGKLEVRLAVLGLRPLLVLTPSTVLIVILGFADGRAVGFWGSVVLIVAFVAIMVFQLLRNVLRNRQGPVMVLDSRGVTVGSYPLVRWAELDRIVIGSVVARSSLLAGLMWGDVVAFIPKPGVAMPPPPGGRGVSAARQKLWQQARLERYGTNLTVLTTLMSVSTGQLAEAAERWGQLPVMRLRRPQPGEDDRSDR